jgi:phage terminase large subunit-like protein
MTDVAMLSVELVRAARAIQANALNLYYTDSGPNARDRYPKHMEWFAAQAHHREVAMFGANRCGKTVCTCFSQALHLTGLYPDWWPGRRFTKPINAWACGTTSKKVRDILQYTLLGPPRSDVGGLIPRHLIEYTTNKVGTADAVESIWVKHKSGGRSWLSFMAYEQGREAFEGESKDLISDDEEPPLEIYTEQLMRLLTTQGLMLLTFIPVKGMTDLVASYMNPDAVQEESNEYDLGLE